MNQTNPEARLSRLVDLRDIVRARDEAEQMQRHPGQMTSIGDVVAAGQMSDAPLPAMNTMRNNRTGAEYQFQSASPGGGQSAGAGGSGSVQLDYSQPIEIFGQGKGYAIKGQPLAAMINGRRVDYGVDQAASKSATQAAQDMEKQSLELTALRSGGGAKPLTESQGKAGTFGLRAEQADELIRSVGKGGAVQKGAIKRSVEAVPFIGDSLGTLANWTQSDEQRQVEQAQRNFINAILRRESGAVISPEEFDNAAKQYFPQPGDDAQTIANKMENRQSSIAGLTSESGRGYEQAKAEFEARKRAIASDQRSVPQSVKVTTPGGQEITFPNAAQADGFRKAAGL